MNQIKRWHLLSPDPARSSALSKQLSLSPIMSQILLNRGVDEEASARAFLSPKLSDLSDPKDIPDIVKASRRILAARQEGEKICVYGDYDVDGVTGTVILLEALKFLGADCDYYIPHRYDEGYGLNNEAIDEIKGLGAKLIVTVDCGIANYEEVEHAKASGLEVVVTDHHNIPRNLPGAVAVVNPKLLHRAHPSYNLSGAGVAFKTAWALIREAGISESGMLFKLLDLVCLGTIADVVPLTLENRILAVQGMSYLSDRKRVGLKSLMEVAGLKQKITTRDVNFGISPRINAAGRLEHAELAIDLLLAGDEACAKEIAVNLNRINIKRQEIGGAIQKEVFAAIGKAPQDEPLIVLDGHGWHPGVIGIVASQVTEAYGRPTVLIGRHDGVGRGSARSTDGINIYELLSSCKEYFTDFGGHEFAAGFEIKSDLIPKFREKLAREARKTIKLEELVPKITIDMEMSVRDISMSLVRELEMLSPHGSGNPDPVFLTRGLKLVESRRVGDGSHLKAKFSDGRTVIDVIGFGHGKAEDSLNYSNSYDIAYELRSNLWNGYESVEMRLIDIRESGGDA